MVRSAVGHSPPPIPRPPPQRPHHGVLAKAQASGYSPEVGRYLFAQFHLLGKAHGTKVQFVSRVQDSTSECHVCGPQASTCAKNCHAGSASTRASQSMCRDFGITHAPYCCRWPPRCRKRLPLVHIGGAWRLPQYASAWQITSTSLAVAIVWSHTCAPAATSMLERDRTTWGFCGSYWPHDYHQSQSSATWHRGDAPPRRIDRKLAPHPTFPLPRPDEQNTCGHEEYLLWLILICARRPLLAVRREIHS